MLRIKNLKYGALFYRFHGSSAFYPHIRVLPSHPCFTLLFVRPFVRPSVCPSVRPSVRPSQFVTSGFLKVAEFLIPS